MFRDLTNTIDSKSVDFEIDSHLRRLIGTRGLNLRFKDRSDDLLGFGRRTLEVAIRQAQLSLEESTEHAINSWETTSKLGDSAISHMEDFLSAFCRHPKELSINGLAHGLYLGHLNAKDRNLPLLRQKMQYSEMEKLAAETLATLATLRWACTFSGGMRDYLANLRHNPGKPGHKHFVRTFMEAWIFLTGKIPSKNNAQFSDLVSAAWTDATGLEFFNWSHFVEMNGRELKPEAKWLAGLGPQWA